MWEEAIRAIPKMWTQDLFSWDGEYFSVPERCILPKPIQKPHPPMWVTTSNPATVAVAGEMGLGVAMFNFSDPELLRPTVERYKEAVAKATPVGEFVNDKIMTITPLFCLEDGDEARALYGRKAGDVSAHFSVYFDSILANAEKLKDEPRPMSQTRIRQLIDRAANDPSTQGPMIQGMGSSKDYLMKTGVCVGSPEDIIDTIDRFRDVGIDQLVFIPVIGWGHELNEKSLESIRQAGKHVLPVARKASCPRTLDRSCERVIAQRRSHRRPAVE